MRKRHPGRPKGSKNATDVVRPRHACLARVEVAIMPARRGGRRRCGSTGSPP